MFTLKNKDDLLSKLQKTPEGIDFDNLKDCYSGVEDDIHVIPLYNVN